MKTNENLKSDNFGSIPELLLQDVDYKVAIFFSLILKKYRYNKNKPITLTNTYFEKVLGIKNKEVNRCIKELTTIGLIEVNKTNKHSISQYSVNMELLRNKYKKNKEFKFLMIPFQLTSKVDLTTAFILSIIVKYYGVMGNTSILLTNKILSNYINIKNNKFQIILEKLKSLDIIQYTTIPYKGTSILINIDNLKNIYSKEYTEVEIDPILIENNNTSTENKMDTTSTKSVGDTLSNKEINELKEIVNSLQEQNFILQSKLNNIENLLQEFLNKNTAAGGPTQPKNEEKDDFDPSEYITSQADHNKKMLTMGIDINLKTEKDIEEEIKIYKQRTDDLIEIFGEPEINKKTTEQLEQEWETIKNEYKENSEEELNILVKEEIVDYKQRIKELTMFITKPGFEIEKDKQNYNEEKIKDLEQRKQKIEEAEVDINNKLDLDTILND